MNSLQKLNLLILEWLQIILGTLEAHCCFHLSDYTLISESFFDSSLVHQYFRITNKNKILRLFGRYSIKISKPILIHEDKNWQLVKKCRSIDY